MKLCSIKDCGRRVKAKGFCASHYGRLIGGRPLDGPIESRAAMGEPMQWIRQLVELPDTDDCINWPFGATLDSPAYSQIRKRPSNVAVGGGRTAKPTTIILEILGFCRPSPSHCALHSCDNPLCVNPSHIRWGTTKENAIEREERGRSASRKYEKLLAWLDEHGIAFPEEMR